MAISNTIYELRRKAGLSQEQLAEQLGVSRQAVSKWESGKAVPETAALVALSQFFQISVDSLLGTEVPTVSAETLTDHDPEKSVEKTRLTGGILCLIGTVILIFGGISWMTHADVMKQMVVTSTVAIDGSGMLAVLGVVVLISGVVLAKKSSHR